MSGVAEVSDFANLTFASSGNELVLSQWLHKECQWTVEESKDARLTQEVLGLWVKSKILRERGSRVCLAWIAILWARTPQTDLTFLPSKLFITSIPISFLRHSLHFRMTYSLFAIKFYALFLQIRIKKYVKVLETI